MTDLALVPVAPLRDCPEHGRAPHRGEACIACLVEHAPVPLRLVQGDQ